MAVDFSHYSRISLPLYAKGVDRGEELTDHWFESVLKAIEPPLFEPVRMKALFAELCWFAPRAHRGRPLGGCRREELAVAIASLERADVPPSILAAIVKRLEQPAARDRLQKPRRASRERRKADRDSFISWTYWEVLEALTKCTEPSIPSLVELVKAADRSATPNEEALRLTQLFLSRDLKLDPPGLRRMRNIVSEKSRFYRDVFGPA